MTTCAKFERFKGRTNSQLHDYTGRRFGRLQVVSRAPSRPGCTMWNCVCACGNHTVVRGQTLKRGDTRSCGCLRRDTHFRHGQLHSSEYYSWAAMKARCSNPRNPGYRYYGQRGIRVCKRWSSFKIFLKDMGEKPGPGYSIERIDNAGNYEPQNCKWANRVEQANNTRGNRRLTVDGETLTTAEWGRRFGVSAARIYRRLSNGWAPAEAVKTPPLKKGKRRCHKATTL